MDNFHLVVKPYTYMISNLKEKEELLIGKEDSEKEWEIIFSVYFSLALVKDYEAIKRSLFLHWYALSEPYNLTGLPDVDVNESKQILQLCNDLASANALDQEMKWMFPYYAKVSEWFFDLGGPYKELATICTENENVWKLYLPKANLSNRGFMGVYWSSIKA